MKSFLLSFIILTALTFNTNAQIAYNPFTQNIHFNPEPSALGFECGTTPSVEFTQGMTTADSAADSQNNPLQVTIAIAGFEFDDSVAANVVSGSYASNFNWNFDPFDPTVIFGVQNQTLYGTGTNPFSPDTRSSGSIIVGLQVPFNIPDNTILSVDVTLQVPTYMQNFNSVPDDNESTQTQSFCSIFPIDLTSFELAQDGCNIRLNWTTASEINGSHFSILRAEQGVDDFQEIAQVNAAGGTSPQKYQFIDNDVSDRESYVYMLEMVDIDNSSVPSNVQSIYFDCGLDKPTVTLYPNPVANSQLKFVYPSHEGNEQLNIDVFDPMGRKITSCSTITTSGMNIIPIKLVDIAAGQYFLRYESVENNNTGTLKFLKE